MQMAAALIEAHPGTYMQTHVAENKDEVRWVAELFPEARSYLDVYHRHRLLNERSVLAHGVWLDDTDRVLLRETGAQIAHSPAPTCSWAAACSTGSAPKGRARTCRWPATSAAAPACR